MNYCNQWHVERNGVTGWNVISESAGSHSYALGYYNALMSFFPHDIRLVNKDGKTVQTNYGLIPHTN